MTRFVPAKFRMLSTDNGMLVLLLVKRLAGWGKVWLERLEAL